MTRKRPPVIYFVSVGYLGLAVLNAIEIWRWRAEYFPHLLLFMALYPIAAYGVFRAYAWAYHLLLVHLGVMLLGALWRVLVLGTVTLSVLLEILLLLAFLWILTRDVVRWVRFMPRYLARFEATVRQQGRALAATGVNISGSGCCVRLDPDAALQFGKAGEIESRLEDRLPVAARGRVAWIAREADHATAGISFGGLDRDNRGRLRDIVGALHERATL